MFRKRRRRNDTIASRPSKRRSFRSGDSSDSWADVIGAAIAALLEAIF